MNSNSTTKTLIGLLIESIEDPTAWQAFLHMFADAMGASGAFSLEPPKISGSVGLDMSWWKKYETHFEPVNPYVPYPFQTGRVNLSGEMVAPADLVRTEYYNDFLRPQGWYHSTCVQFCAGDEKFYLIALRPEQGGDFTPQIPLFERVAPHVQRAYRVWKYIQDLEAKLDRVVTRELDRRKLISLYALTPPEVRLAAAIFKGESVEMYAKQNNIPINTARWRVRQIYNKTGAKRQSELIKILANVQVA